MQFARDNTCDGVIVDRGARIGVVVANAVPARNVLRPIVMSSPHLDDTPPAAIAVKAAWSRPQLPSGGSEDVGGGAHARRQPTAVAYACSKARSVGRFATLVLASSSALAASLPLPE